MAGGESQVGGNGSVWWRVAHYEDPTPEKPVHRAMRMATAVTPGSDEVHIGNHAMGHDQETSVADVGGRFDHPGRFAVTMLFPDMAAVRASGEWLVDHVTPRDGGGYELRILVPAIDRTAPPENRNDWEVCVQW